MVLKALLVVLVTTLVTELEAVVGCEIESDFGEDKVVGMVDWLN